MFSLIAATDNGSKVVELYRVDDGAQHHLAVMVTDGANTRTYRPSWASVDRVIALMRSDTDYQMGRAYYLRILGDHPAQDRTIQIHGQHSQALLDHADRLGLPAVVDKYSVYLGKDGRLYEWPLSISVNDQTIAVV